MGINHKLLATKDVQEFLESEYQNVFSRCFKDFTSFEKVMGSEVLMCDKCGMFYWKGCTKRCDYKNVIRITHVRNQ